MTLSAPMDTAPVLCSQKVKLKRSQNLNKSHDYGNKTARDEWGGDIDTGEKEIREGRQE